MMNRIDIIHREAIVTEEPVECDLCGRLAERGHVGDLGWACVACCEMHPEYAVSTQAAGGVTTAWIGAQHIGTIDAWIGARYSCETCHDQGWVYPDGSQYGTRDDDVPCPDCSRRAR